MQVLVVTVACRVCPLWRLTLVLQVAWHSCQVFLSAACLFTHYTTAGILLGQDQISRVRGLTRPGVLGCTPTLDIYIDWSVAPACEANGGRRDARWDKNAPAVHRLFSDNESLRTQDLMIGCMIEILMACQEALNGFSECVTFATSDLFFLLAELSGLISRPPRPPTRITSAISASLTCSQHTRPHTSFATPRNMGNEQFDKAVDCLARGAAMGGGEGDRRVSKKM